MGWNVANAAYVMTALEFIASGIEFRNSGATVTVHGPAGAKDLLDQLRFEVATRMCLVEDMESNRKPSPWSCELCGDQIGHGPGGTCLLCPDSCLSQHGGMCFLCILARQKFLKEQGNG